ncbi:MlaD family protein [Mycobacterium pseudoshottsii]|uniref:MlaD family protein n=1 Tax=Mycobacterium pseudoshottsii TaxID=265949 RepID=UPI00295494DD|nr:MlaD family protein [Mycobacterium pseudoshottsii]BEH74379.1 putative Mce family protein [Mycobacterium pseudoshottsii]
MTDVEPSLTNMRGGRHTWLSCVGLLLTLVVSVAYLLIGVLHVRPLASNYALTVELGQSGGLLPNQDVALHGVQIGKVESLEISRTGVTAILRINAGVRIPVASTVRVSALSPAGEQYVDFNATSGEGPFLKNGDAISQDRTTTPVTPAELLQHADGVLAQIDPAKLAGIRRELNLSKAAPEKLTAIVDGGVFLISTLDSVLPQTVSLLRNSRVVLSAAIDVNDGIDATARNVHQLLTGVSSMDDGYRRMVDQTPGVLEAADNLFSDNSDTMVQLLGNLTTVAKLSYLRVPALKALFPDYRGSALEAFMSTMHDGGLWATADLYPRYTCDYGTPSHPPSAADYPEPFLYTYGRDDDPAVLIRGARNAPRPPGDDTAGPPPGADLGATTGPTPQGRFTIPTPYGGPRLPIEPPH